MAYYPYKQVLLSLIILSLINNFMRITNARYINLDINPKITLRFISGLPENSSVAKVRCQSKDDDLGDRTLNPGDQFDFSFRMNFFATTLYFCSFTWGTKHNSFDVFKGGKSYCPNRPFKRVYCTWLLKDSGIYLALGSNPPPESFKFIHPWLS
ncbi:hypothetical protein P3L10_003793 [Capsicum annuum]